MAMGRPREFDVDRALDQALDVFWRHGYEGTSLSDLTEAMGVTRPSLYAAFGNKEELFRKVLDRYGAMRTDPSCDVLNEPTSRRAVERLLLSFAGAGSGDDAPRGCLMVQGALVCSEASDAIRQELTARRAQGEARLRDRLEEWQAAGDLPADANPECLARYVMAVANGMAVQATGGASPDDLKNVVELTMKGWPAPPAAAPA
ncbi:TetR/AcrR family transcriptional regulator [Aureimonas sp. AU12]|uniref:TetR/AcrR family transcriptional regulator n=1 Tax=Aureimonas sp. AU12 TaxID=1638161 RepID=UPI0007831DC5|nr:TetR/AcrR family transcriptional regulator [Aureimonas sp. AU12]